MDYEGRSDSTSDAHTEEASPKRSYRSPAVERAFEVLSVLSHTREAASLAELARATSTPPSSLLAVLRSLETYNVVKATSDKRYKLDVGLLQLGQAYVDGNDLITLFEPVGKKMLAEFNETVQLGVLAGSEVVYIARRESTQPIRLVALVGRRLPAYASAVGKALLAWLDKSELRDLLGSEPFDALTPNTVTTYDALERQLVAIRSHGFGESQEECIRGLHCISAPVFDHTGAAVAGLCVSVPTTRMKPRSRARMLPAVMGAAAQLSAAMGAAPEPAIVQSHAAG